MYQILEVANCYLFLIFAQVLWTRIVRSKPIIKTLLMFQFHIQRLKTSGPIPELKKNLVSDWKNVIAYWELRHQQTNSVHSKNSWGFRVVAAVQPQKKLGICTLMKTWKVFPGLKQRQNCYIMNIAFPTHHILGFYAADSTPVSGVRN